MMKDKILEALSHYNWDVSDMSFLKNIHIRF